MASSEDGRVVRSAALWGTILNIGGVLLITGTLGYSALTIQAYEDRCGSVADCAPAGAVDAMDASEKAAAQDVNTVDAMPDEPGQNVALTETPPQGPNPAMTAQIEKLSKDLMDARGKLADADATNAALQNRVTSLEQQAASQGEAASAVAAQVAQCRSDLGQARDRFERTIERFRLNSQRLERELNACRQQIGQPITG